MSPKSPAHKRLVPARATEALSRGEFPPPLAPTGQAGGTPKAGLPGIVLMLVNGHRVSLATPVTFRYHGQWYALNATRKSGGLQLVRTGPPKRKLDGHPSGVILP